MKKSDEEQIRQYVRERYGMIARQENSSGCGCCGDEVVQIGAVDGTRLGYSPEDLTSVPDGAEMGLGCGNPQAIAELKPGEVVVDLGSGGGFDCFLAAKQVGSIGRVIGVDMTPDMVSKARRNAEQGGYQNVEFRLGEIEHLPVADNTVDVIISNCVINLSPDKPSVFRDMFRILRPGGRLAISDVVSEQQLPEEIRNNPKMLCACIGGAASIDELQRMMAEAGFIDIRVIPKEESREVVRQWAPGTDIDRYVVSATIQAKKAN